jgi:pyrimidine deaminase RibD-like protein
MNEGINVNEIREDDRKKMSQAIELSRTSPEVKTFRVGCVITDANGKELATGYTGEKVGFHAEEIAISKLVGSEKLAKNGSIFSTVEPCHPRKSGKTSCTEHILKFGLARVLYVLDEPPIFVDCLGAETLSANGLKVIRMPEFEEEVRAINKLILNK